MSRLTSKHAPSLLADAHLTTVRVRGPATAVYPDVRFGLFSFRSQLRLRPLSMGSRCLALPRAFLIIYRWARSLSIGFHSVPTVPFR